MSHKLNENLTISPAGLALIKKWEGWYPKAYKDPVGIWTIGWGTTGAEARPGRTITKKQGEEFLRRDLLDEEASVKRLTDVPLTQHQFDALVSFVYNCGSGNYSRSTLRKMLNRGNFASAAAQFPRWNRARNRETGEWLTLRGLTNRRNDEAALFVLPDSDDTYAREAEVISKRPQISEPHSNESTVTAETPSFNENTLREIVSKSDTVKAAVVAITSLGAVVSQSMQPLFANPVTAIAVVIAFASTSALIYIKWRDTREQR